MEEPIATITAEVYNYNKEKDVYQVKIEPIPGMFINSIRVSKSPKKPEEGLWVQMPSYRYGSQWKRYVELAKSSPIREAVEAVCIKAVRDYQSANLDDDFGQRLDEAMKIPL